MLFLIILEIVTGILIVVWGETGQFSYENLLLIVNFGFRIYIGILAAKGYRPNDAKTINYVGMVIIAFIPIGSWVAFFYASKTIAKQFSSVIYVVVGTAVVVLGILRLNNTLRSNYPVTQAVIPTATVIPTKKPTITPTAKLSYVDSLVATSVAGGGATNEAISNKQKTPNWDCFRSRVSPIG